MRRAAARAVLLCALAPAALAADAGPRSRATDGLGETPLPAPDAPVVQALPAATPEEGLARLRSAAAAGRDDQALGEAYDYLRRYPESAERGEIGLAIGALHLRRGEAERAAAALEPIASADGEFRSRAIHLLGAALNALGRDEEILKSVPEADPAATDDRWLALAQVWRAAALDRLGRKEEAGELYRAIVASRQKSPLRAYALAAVAADWERRGRPERARDALKRAQDEAAASGLSDLRDALALAAAHALTRARRLSEAVQAYADFAESYPDSPLLAQALMERGLALKRLGRKGEAAASFEALLKARPDSVYAGDAHLQLGQLYGELGRSDAAIAQYQAMGKTSEAKDAGREALLLSAQVHYNAKEWREAVPLYRRYLESAPSDEKKRQVQGLLLACLWQSDRDDPQIQELAAALPENELVGQIRWDLAAKAYKRGDWAAAEPLFRREVESAPRGARAADARFYRAEALRQLGRSDAAIDAYERFLRNHPGDARAASARMRLGLLLDAAGRHEAAAAAFARVTGADAADAAYDRAAALAKSGRDPAPEWEAFAARWPRHEKASWAWLAAAKLREEKRSDDAAVADYEKVSDPAERAKALYAAGRIHEKHKKRAAAKAAYASLKDARPLDDPARMAGLVRLALMLELEDKAQQAYPLYSDVAAHADRASKPYETARKRLDALAQSNDPSIVR